MSLVDRSRVPREWSDSSIQDDKVLLRLDFLEGWRPIPTETPRNEREWAHQLVTTANRAIVPVNFDGLAQHLIEVGRAARAGGLPQTDVIRAYQPIPDGQVMALMTVAAIPREYVDGPLGESIRTLGRRASTLVREEPVSIVALPVGEAARWQCVRARETRRGIFARKRELLERVLYLIQPNDVDDFRIVVDGWWEELALGSALADHIDRMAASISFAPVK